MLTVTKFYADYCQPCKLLGPLYKKLEEHYVGQPVTFKNIDVDEDRTAAEKNGIRTVPTITVQDETGEIIGRWVGVKSMQDYINGIDLRLKVENEL